MKTSSAHRNFKRRSRFGRTESAPCLYFGLLVLAVIALYPRLSTGFTTNDDTQIALHVDLGRLWVQSLNTAIEQGRLCHLFLVPQLGVPYLIPHPVYYYSVAIGAIVSNFVAFYFLVRTFFSSERVALFLTALGISYLQYHWHHGMTTSYPFGYSAAFTAFLCALIVFCRWQRHHRHRDALLSASLYLWALLTQEHFVPYVVFFLLASLYASPAGSSVKQRFRMALRDLVPILIALISFLIAYAAFRRAFPGNYAGVVVNSFNLHDVAAVLWQFSVSTLPGYFYFKEPAAIAQTFDGFGEFHGGLFGIFQNLRVEFLIKALILGSLSYVVLTARGTKRDSMVVHLARLRGALAYVACVAVGALAIIVPICLLALTVKYQFWVIRSHTLAYIHCYYASFGTMWILGVSLLWLKQLVSRWRVVAVLYGGSAAIAIAVASLATDEYNSYITRDQHLSQLKWRAVNDLIRTMPFKAIPDAAIIYAPALHQPRNIVANFPGYWSGYFMARAGKQLFICRNGEELAQATREHPFSPRYFLSYQQEPKEANQFLVLAPMQSGPDGETDSVYAKTASIFTYSKNRKFVVVGQYQGAGGVTIKINNRFVARAAGGIFAEQVDRSDTSDALAETTLVSTAPVNVSHITLSYFPVLPVLRQTDFTYGVGFHGEERDETTRLFWNWSAGNAEMFVWNRGERIETCLTFDAMTFSQPRTLTITCGEARQTVAFEPGVHMVHVTLPVTLEPGRNKVSLVTDRAGALVGSGDTRPIAFGIQDFTICGAPR